MSIVKVNTHMIFRYSALQKSLDKVIAKLLIVGISFNILIFVFALYLSETLKPRQFVTEILNRLDSSK